MLRHLEWECCFLKGKRLNVLVVECRNSFYKIHRDLFEQFSQNEEHYVLSNEHQLLQFNKYVEWIANPWACDLNSRKALVILERHIFDRIEIENKEHELFLLWERLREIIVDTAGMEDNVISTSELNSLAVIIKAFNLKFNLDHGNSMALFIEDFLIHKLSYTDSRVFVFSNLLSYFTDKEVFDFARFCTAEEIPVLLIEPSGLHYLKDVPSTRIVLIDEDLCDTVVLS